MALNDQWIKCIGSLPQGCPNLLPAGSLPGLRSRVTQNRDTVPAASPWAPRAGKKSEEYRGHERHRTSSTTHGRGTSCDHNLHAVSYLTRIDLLCSTPAASKSFVVR
jgi:hypothetical protein